MSLLGDSLSGGFVSAFNGELSNACAAGSVIGFSLLAVVVVWGQVRKFLHPDA